MRSQRLIRKRNRSKNTHNFEIDITSLLDILVILLVFLLKSYNSTGMILNVPEEVQLPMSESRKENSSGVTVQVSPAKIWVEDEKILDISEVSGDEIGRFYDQNEMRIIPLFNNLVQKKQEVQRVEKTIDGAKDFSGILNLVVDKSIKYTYLQKLMYTAAEAGFKKYNFVVQGE